MNTKIKFLVRLLLAIGIFTFSSCEKDLYEEAIQQKRELTMRKISLNELSKKDNSKLFETVDLISSKKGDANSKMIYDPKNKFYFDDTNGKEIISADGLKSYTFQIYTSDSLAKVENILFTEKRNGDYDAYKVKYDFTQKELKSLSKKQLSKLKVEYKYIKASKPKTTSKESYNCLEISEWNSYPNHQGDLRGDFGYEGEWVTLAVVCSSTNTEDQTDLGGISNTGWNSGIFNNTNQGNTNGTIPGGVYSSPVITPGVQFINSLNFDTKDNVLSLSNDAQKIVFDYLTANNFSDTSKARAKYVLDHFNFFWITEQPAGTDITIFNYFYQNSFSSESLAIISNWISLKTELKSNPNLLLKIPCSEIVKWQALINFQIPSSVKNKITSLDNQSLLTDYNIQYLEHANGAAINLDYFPVTINTLPKNPATGIKFTPTQFLNYVRLNINNFVDTNISRFSPTTLTTGYNESQIWNSSNPLGAIIHINIPQFAGDGSVICSQSDSNHWVFTTIEVPYGIFQGQDGIHPVSGNREFGLIQNSNGTYTFYTRGVDRMTDGFESTIAENSTIFVDPFANPDKLWNSLKTKVSNFVQNNGGSSVTPTTSQNVIWRPDWYKVRQVLRGEIPISDLGC